MSISKKILITGGLGYIGSLLSIMLFEKGYKVRVLDNISSLDKRVNQLVDNTTIEYIEGDLLNKIALNKATQGVDYVIHLAGVSDGRAGKLNPELTKKINIEALDFFLEISKKNKVKKFMFASTMGVYGNKYKIPLHEELKLNPIDPYSNSKAEGEELVLMENSDVFKTVALRLAMVYGVSPSIRTDFIVNRLTLDAFKNNHITLFGGNQKRPQVHIKDVCRAFIEMTESELTSNFNQTFNIVSSNPSLLDIAEIIKIQLPDTFVEIKPERKDEDSFEMVNTKFSQFTGFEYLENIENAVKELVVFYKKAQLN